MDRDFNGLLQGPDYVTTEFSETVAKVVGAAHEALVISGLAGSLAKEKALRFIKGQAEPAIAVESAPWYEAVPQHLREPAGRLEKALAIVDEQREPDEVSLDNARMIDYMGFDHQRRLALREPIPRFTRAKEAVRKIKSVSAKASNLVIRGGMSKSW